LDKLSESLNELKSGNPLSAEMFGELEVDELQNGVVKTLLETIDAAIHTLEERFDKGQVKESSLEEILLDYDHDALIARANYIKEVVKSILITGFKKIISPVTDPIIGQIDEAIPDPMNKFLKIELIYDGFISALVSEPINQSVNKAYSLPASA